MKSLFLLLCISICTQGLKQVDVIQANLTQITEVSIDSAVEKVLVFPVPSLAAPYKVTTWNTNPNFYPISVIIEQDIGVQSWSIPFLNTSIYNVSKTLCHNDINVNTPKQHFIATLSTFSPSTLNVSVQVEEDLHFYIKKDVKYTSRVTQGNPKVFFYKYSTIRTGTVIVDVIINDNTTLLASVQQNHCPVVESSFDITLKTIHETIKGRGGMTIKRNSFKNGFFLVLVALHGNSNSSDNINFKLTEGTNSDNLIKAVLIVVGGFLVFGVVAICLEFLFKKLYDPPPGATLLNQPPPNNNNQVENYYHLWKVLTIAVFYSIPMIQLILTYQVMVRPSISDDFCYYNYLCAYPALGLDDFNHVFSSVSYIGVGVIFLGVVTYRHCKRPEPVSSGIYAAMGIALVLEGILTGCHHICPNQSNHHFSNSFLYVMAVLFMVKLYQSRHSDVNAAAFTTFTILGSTIAFALMGNFNIDNDSTVLVTCAFFMYVFICVFFSIRFYFIYGIVFLGFKQLWLYWRGGEYPRINLQHFGILLFANLINWGLFVLGLYWCYNKMADCSTLLLFLLMGNSLLYAGVYTRLKVIYGERVNIVACIYGVLAVTLWIIYYVYFLHNGTFKILNPTDSRDWNQPCILQNFYDKHDLWHFASASAFYFSFMFSLYVDEEPALQNRAIF